MGKNNKKLTYEEVYNYFKEQGCELLEKEYINSSTKMKYRCVCGNIDYKTWIHFKRGQRCKKCGRQKQIEKQKTNIEDIRKFFEKHGFVLISNEYDNVNTVLKCKCTCGNIAFRTWAAFKQAPRCTCNVNYTAPIKKNYTEEDLINYFWKFYKENGRYPLLKDFEGLPNYPSPSSYTRKFGSYKNFLLKIDVISEDGWYKHDEEILKKMYENESYEKINEALMIKRSWSSIQHKANQLGLKRSHEAKYGNKYYSNQDLIKILQDYYKENKEVPTTKIFDELDNFPSPHIYRHRFGSWNKALEAAGLPIINENKILKDKIDKDEFISDYHKLSIDDLKRKYGYKSDSSIYRLVKEFGLPFKNNHWSEEQIQILKEKYAYESWDNLLKLLHPFRKEDIITKAYKLGLKRECYGYSDEEIKILKENYGKVSFEEIKKLLPNKTESSIMSKASKLGLVMREKWTEEEIEKLKELYPYYTNEELQKFFPNRTISSISSMATMKLNLTKASSYKEKYKEQTRQKLLQKLKDFAKELGRTPTIDEINKNKEMPGAMSYHRYFGSYTNACELAGLEVNAAIFGKSYHYVSKNGDVCLSSKELEITNILIDNNINYEKEVLYRDIIEDESLPLIRCDWLINDEIVVEYFGMPEKEEYQERMLEKIELCQDHDIKLIALFPEDLKRNYEGLVQKFKDFGIDIKIT
jgi:hypothetical protein